jgi:hypothetical protein
MSRTRRRSGGVERLGQKLEEGGHALLTGTWTIVIRVLWLVVRPASRMVAAAGRWFRDLPGVFKVLVGFAAVAVVIASVSAFRNRSAGDMPYVSDETEALARVIRSEIGNGSPQQRLHVAWATRNLALEHGQTVAEMACSPCGRQERGRPVSSRQEATDADRLLARLVLAQPAMLDPTGGATHFINPALQDQLAARGAPGYRGRTYDRVRATWSGAYGWEPYYRLGRDLELWGTKRR